MPQFGCDMELLSSKLKQQYGFSSAIDVEPNTYKVINNVSSDD